MNLASCFRGLGLLPIRKDACHDCASLGSQFRLSKTTLENEVEMPRNFSYISTNRGGGLRKSGEALLGLSDIPS